mgnify:CR=1 FL=1
MMTLTVAIEKAMRARRDKASEEAIKKAYAEVELIMDIMVAGGRSRETVDELAYNICKTITKKLDAEKDFNGIK